MAIELKSPTRSRGIEPSNHGRRSLVSGSRTLQWESIAGQNLSQAIARSFCLSCPALSGNESNRRVDKPLAVRRLPDSFKSSRSDSHGRAIIQARRNQRIE
jgi:hypothetical protein